MGSLTPVVSIVTPSLNQGRFIRDTVESVLRQDYPAIEYLVVDGASTDGTKDVLRAYGDRIRWLSEPDAGQSAAINKGWRQTRGEFIAWLNADDCYVAGAVRQAAEFLRAHPDVDVVYGRCDYIESRGHVLRPYPTQPHSYVDMVRGTSNYIPQPATFMRRRLLDDIGPLDETLHYVMDFDYWLRCGRTRTIRHLPTRLASMRLHPDARSVRDLAGFADELVRVYERLFSDPQLPASVRATRPRAMSNIHYRAASCRFWGGDITGARDHILRAWRYDHTNARRTILLVLGPGSFGQIGWRAAWAARRWLVGSL